MDANSGEPWSEADISDLKNELDHGRTIAETASFLCRVVGFPQRPGRHEGRQWRPRRATSEAGYSDLGKSVTPQQPMLCHSRRIS
jgi:hypothetical protein